MKKREITAETKEIQTVIREYYKQLHANKLDNLEELETFLETYNLLRLNQGVGNLSEFKAVIKKLPTNKSPGLDNFT